MAQPGHHQWRHFARRQLLALDLDRARNRFGVIRRVGVVVGLEVAFDWRVEVRRCGVIVGTKINLNLATFTLHVNLHTLEVR